MATSAQCDIRPLLGNEKTVGRIAGVTIAKISLSRPVEEMRRAQLQNAGGAVRPNAVQVQSNALTAGSIALEVQSIALAVDSIAVRVGSIALKVQLIALLVGFIAELLRSVADLMELLPLEGGIDRARSSNESTRSGVDRKFDTICRGRLASRFGNSRTLRG